MSPKKQDKEKGPLAKALDSRVTVVMQRKDGTREQFDIKFTSVGNLLKAQKKLGGELRKGTAIVEIQGQGLIAQALRDYSSGVYQNLRKQEEDQKRII